MNNRININLTAPVPETATTIQEQIFYPLISCIMPTAGRAQYVAQSIQYFLAQDYPAKELVIVYNKPTDLPAMPFPAHVRPVQVNTHVIGARRNEAIRHARGSIIAHWDDDDIYSPGRLTQQAMPVITGQAHITGLHSFVFLELATGTGWMPQKILFSDIFVGNVHGGSLVYDRAVWEQLANYPNTGLGEDAAFVARAVKRGAKLMPLNGYDTFIYLRHGSNTWQFEEDNFRRYNGWQRVKMPQWAAPFAPFYRQMAMNLPALSDL